MTTEKYMDMRNEIEDTILMDTMNSVPFFDDVYSEEIVDAVLDEMFRGEELDTVDKIIRRDAIRGVLVDYQREIENLYNVLILSMDDYEEAESEEEMAEWVDAKYIFPVWPVVRRAVRRYWKNFKEDRRAEETKAWHIDSETYRAWHNQPILHSEDEWDGRYQTYGDMWAGEGYTID